MLFALLKSLARVRHFSSYAYFFKFDVWFKIWLFNLCHFFVTIRVSGIRLYAAFNTSGFVKNTSNGFSANQSNICHSWFRLNSGFFETPCSSIDMIVISRQTKNLFTLLLFISPSSSIQNVQDQLLWQKMIPCSILIKFQENVKKCWQTRVWLWSDYPNLSDLGGLPPRNYTSSSEQITGYFPQNRKTTKYWNACKGQKWSVII